MKLSIKNTIKCIKANNIVQFFNAKIIFNAITRNQIKKYVKFLISLTLVVFVVSLFLDAVVAVNNAIALFTMGIILMPLYFVLGSLLKSLVSKSDVNKNKKSTTFSQKLTVSIKVIILAVFYLVASVELLTALMFFMSL